MNPDLPRVWFDADEPPTHWRCPHDRALVALANMSAHVERFHADCRSCQAEELLTRGILDISSIRPEQWHGRLGGVPPVPRGA